ncbi:MAG: glycoside hydrolase family 13 protein [Rhizobacter sp.]|nr:glycoside hydrolase family 13 protein [Rhizobacter sp.]
MSDFTPEWARHAVWYQILPERFANGDPGNDPTADSLQGAVHGPALHPGWQTHPWTSDWYAQQPWESASDKSLHANLADRRYGGDIAGILKRLPHLQELGVTALYLNPVFDAPSHHKYDAATLHHVDVHFGPDPAGDRALMAMETPDDPGTWVWTSADRLMLKLINQVHVRGMRIIFDGVFNHVGLRHWAFADLVARQRKSRFRDWFKVRSWRDEKAGFQYDGWRGHATLPELKHDADTLADGPLSYVNAVTRRWMAPNGEVARGIDGWRLDVAPCLPHGFWKGWRKHVKAINPQAYLVAETLLDPAGDAPFLQGDEFDAVMNYNFAFACDEFFFRDAGRIGASEFDQRLRELREAYPPCVAPVMQNLIDSHDTARAASHIVNHERIEFRRFAERYHAVDSRAPAFDTRKPNARERALQRLFVLFQMTALGAPMIYYGDEAGLWGANDPCCRKPMLWPDLQYAHEAIGPDGKPRPRPDPVEFDQSLFEHYKRCIALRNALPALRTGKLATLLCDDARSLLVHLRSEGIDHAAVAINRGAEAAGITLTLPKGRWADMLTGKALKADAKGKVQLTLAPVTGTVLAISPG